MYGETLRLEECAASLRSALKEVSYLALLSSSSIGCATALACSAATRAGIWPFHTGVSTLSIAARMSGQPGKEGSGTPILMDSTYTIACSGGPALKKDALPATGSRAGQD